MPIQEITTSLTPLLVVAVSLGAVPLILLSSRRPNLREFWTLLAAIAKFTLVLTLLPGAQAGKITQISLFRLFPGVDLCLKADPFGVYFALIASGLWILTSVYSIGYMRGGHEHKQTRYYACFAVCLSATMGIAFAGNLITFLLFYEILTIATYPLVIHKETKTAITAGRKYLVYTLSAGLLLIAAALWTFQLTGTLDFQAGGFLSASGLDGKTLVPLFLLFIGGVGVKAGIMPLHSWLPTAMAAPTPVSALLHAVAVVKSGVFGVLRVVGFVFGPTLMKQFGLDTILIVLAAVTIILASLIAMRQDNLKRRLAYSTIGHLSYIVMGAALLSPMAFSGAVLHIAFHAFMKITLFFTAGAIYINLHRENVSELSGIGRIMPWTMGAFALGSLGLAGIPPVNGFVSKWVLGLGAVQSGHPYILAVFVFSGLLNAAYLFPIVHRAFFKPGEGLEGKTEASPWMVAPLVVTALFSLLFGIYPDLFFRLVQLAAAIGGQIGGLLT